ncbi:MAG: Ig-like domain repeat protein [Nocardioidaceae bacterium]|nr:Ig-like domain repeat protein [Nocardioidaceae bacterium]
MLHPIPSLRRILLVLSLALGLLAPVAATSVADAAGEPKPTTLKLSVSYGDHVGETYYVNVVVRGPDDEPVSGDVVFTGITDGNPVALSPAGVINLDAVATSNDPVAVTATYQGNSEYAGSSASAATTPLVTPYFSPDPTIAKIGPGLKLTLTLSTHAKNFVGAPMAGVPVVFTLFGPGNNVAPGPAQSDPSVVVCRAVTDASGFASCKGSGLLGSIVSILSGAWAAWDDGTLRSIGHHTKLPVIVTG